MLSVFPELLWLAPLSAFLIRVAVGIVLGYSALQHFKTSETTSRPFAIAEGTTAIGLILGLYTQPVAILGVLIAGAWIVLPRLRTVALGTALLSLVLCVTLLITGAGPFAFDLPL